MMIDSVENDYSREPGAYISSSFNLSESHSYAGDTFKDNKAHG